MTRQEVNQMIASMKLPYEYYQFPEGTGQAPPFITFFFSNNSDVFADDENYCEKEQLNVELYTRTRDFDLEKQVEAVLRENGFSYAQYPAYIDAEKLWQIAYEMEVVING